MAARDTLEATRREGRNLLRPGRARPTEIVAAARQAARLLV